MVVGDGITCNVVSMARSGNPNPIIIVVGNDVTRDSGAVRAKTNTVIGVVGNDITSDGVIIAVNVNLDAMPVVSNGVIRDSGIVCPFEVNAIISGDVGNGITRNYVITNEGELNGIVGVVGYGIAQDDVVPAGRGNKEALPVVGEGIPSDYTMVGKIKPNTCSAVASNSIIRNRGIAC